MSLTIGLLLLSLLSACGFLWPAPVPGHDTGKGAIPSNSGVDCQAAPFLGNQPEIPRSGRIVGRVASPSGQVPVAGAEITVQHSEAWATSVTAGCFYLDLPPGPQVLLVQKGRYRAQTTVEVEADGVLDLGTLALDSGGLRVAVVEGHYDSVELLLTHIGLPYDRFARTEDLIDHPDVLDRYDALFANCGSETSRSNSAHFNPGQFGRLRAWVADGGTLYVSDMEYSLFAGAVPEALDFAETEAAVLRGPVGTVQATLLFRDVIQLLETDRAEIRFDLPYWAVADGPGEATVVVEAEVEGRTRPLAALHRLGEGRAVFTSFHNDAQATQDMQTILYELILAL